MLYAVADESEREVQDTAKEPESTHHDTANSSNHIQDDSSSSGDDGAKLTEHSSGSHQRHLASECRNESSY